MLLAFACGGCSVLHKGPRQEANYFDLSYPSAPLVGEGVVVEVDAVRSDQPYDERMVFRVTGHRLEIDEFNRWAGRPEAMVEKYLALAFAAPPEPGAAKCRVAVRILQLEARLSPPAVTVALWAEIRRDGGDAAAFRKAYRRELPLDGGTGESFARSVGDALSAIAKEMAADASACGAMARE